MYLWLPHLVQGFFVFAAGACVGSFINLIAWRLPRGQGIIHPASRCTACGRALSWFENVPILSYIFLNGRCRTCRTRFGVEHLVIEFCMGMLFFGTYFMLYAGPWQARASDHAWWWIRNGPLTTMPALLAVLTCWSTLAAVSLIDARTFYVPIRITAASTVAAFLLWRMQALVPSIELGFNHSRWGLDLLPIPLEVAAVFGLVGLAISAALLWRRLLPRSFAGCDMETIRPRTVRIEVLKEVLFLLPIAIAMAAGYWIGSLEAVQAWCHSATFAALGISSMGFLAGGGIIWATRIAGSLAFGREAMGLGDVHILGAAGAALGWRFVVTAYFLAPFIALAWLALSGGLHRILGTRSREVPYGPYLAVACVVSFLGSPWIDPFLRSLLMPMASGE